MTVTRRARELAIVAMLLALPFLFLRANVKSPSDLNALDRTLLRISAPLQSAVTWVARGVGAAWSRYLFLVHVEADNTRLTRENARLQAELERARHEAARAGVLDQLLGMRSALPLPARAGHVVAVESSSFFRVVRLRLDLGDEPQLAPGAVEESGATEVRPYMPVMAPAGVVGRVQRVFGRYCDVLLAVDPKSSIDVVVPRTGGRGLLKGMPGDNRYRARIEYLLRKDDVVEGDLVVTSGLGGTFPRNLPVGRIARVTRRDYGLYQEAEVEPVVDFGKLTDVLVLLAPPADTPEPPADKRGLP